MLQGQAAQASAASDAPNAGGAPDASARAPEASPRAPEVRGKANVRVTLEGSGGATAEGRPGQAQRLRSATQPSAKRRATVPASLAASNASAAQKTGANEAQVIAPQSRPKRAAKRPVGAGVASAPAAGAHAAVSDPYLATTDPYVGQEAGEDRLGAVDGAAGGGLADQIRIANLLCPHSVRRVIVHCWARLQAAEAVAREFQELDADQPLPDLEMLGAAREQQAAQRRKRLHREIAEAMEAEENSRRLSELRGVRYELSLLEASGKRAAQLRLDVAKAVFACGVVQAMAQVWAVARAAKTKKPNAGAVLEAQVAVLGEKLAEAGKHMSQLQGQEETTRGAAQEREQKLSRLKKKIIDLEKASEAGQQRLKEAREQAEAEDPELLRIEAEFAERAGLAAAAAEAGQAGADGKPSIVPTGIAAAKKATEDELEANGVDLEATAGHLERIHDDLQEIFSSGKMPLVAGFAATLNAVQGLLALPGLRRPDPAAMKKRKEAAQREARLARRTAASKSAGKAMSKSAGRLRGKAPPGVESKAAPPKKALEAIAPGIGTSSSAKPAATAASFWRRSGAAASATTVEAVASHSDGSSDCSGSLQSDEGGSSASRSCSVCSSERIVHDKERGGDSAAGDADHRRGGRGDIPPRRADGQGVGRAPAVGRRRRGSDPEQGGGRGRSVAGSVGQRALRTPSRSPGWRQEGDPGGRSRRRGQVDSSDRRSPLQNPLAMRSGMTLHPRRESRERSGAGSLSPPGPRRNGDGDGARGGRGMSSSERGRSGGERRGMKRRHSSSRPGSGDDDWRRRRPQRGGPRYAKQGSRRHADSRERQNGSRRGGHGHGGGHGSGGQGRDRSRSMKPQGDGSRSPSRPPGGRGGGNGGKYQSGRQGGRGGKRRGGKWKGNWKGQGYHNWRR